MSSCVECGEWNVVTAEGGSPHPRHHCEMRARSSQEDGYTPDALSNTPVVASASSGMNNFFMGVISYNR